MAGNASAFAVLGLRPDADWSTVERTYKALIKTHHPDRLGGDAGRAAEINRAYRELRDERWRARPAATPDWVDAEPFAEPLPEPRPASPLWFVAALTLIAVAALMIALTQVGRRGMDGYAGGAGSLLASARTPHHASRRSGDAVADALDRSAIKAGVADAVRMARAGNAARIMEASSACYERLQRRPGLSALDRCVAFDDAIVQLQNRDPLHDDGPFAQLAVTGREMNSGELLSHDYVAIDSRLNHIRLQVELALAPPPAPAPVANQAELNALD